MNKRNITLLAFFFIGFFTVNIVYAQVLPLAGYWKDGVWNELGLPNGTRSGSLGGIAISNDVVYVAGSYYNAQFVEIACIWRNNSVQDLNLPNGARFSRAEAITISGDVVYVAGWYYSDVEGRAIACYWRNGIIQNLILPREAGDSYALGIAVSNDMVYVVGTYGQAIPFYCKNETIQNLSIPDGAFLFGLGDITGIAVSGDVVYVSGNYTIAESHARIACYWRNGELQTLNIPNGAMLSSATDIALSGNIIYVAGSYFSQNSTIPCIWRNDAVNDLSLPNGVSLWQWGNIGGIAVSDNLIYVTGSYNSHSFGNVTPCYWRNGVLTSLIIPAIVQNGTYHAETYDIAVSGNSVYVLARFREPQ